MKHQEQEKKELYRTGFINERRRANRHMNYLISETSYRFLDESSLHKYALTKVGTIFM